MYYPSLEELNEQFGNITVARALCLVDYLEIQKLDAFKTKLQNAWKDAVSPSPAYALDNIEYHRITQDGILRVTANEVYDYDREGTGRSFELNMPLNVAENEEAFKAFFVQVAKQQREAEEEEARQRKAESLRQKRNQYERLKKELGEQ